MRQSGEQSQPSRQSGEQSQPSDQPRRTHTGWTGCGDQSPGGGQPSEHAREESQHCCSSRERCPEQGGYRGGEQEDSCQQTGKPCQEQLGELSQPC